MMMMKERERVSDAVTPMSLVVANMYRFVSNRTDQLR